MGYNSGTVKHYKKRFKSLVDARTHLDPEFKAIRDAIGVDTGDFDDSKANKKQKKNAFHKKNINSMANFSSKMLASLLVTHLTSPKVRWFEFELDGEDPTRDEKIWLRKCENITYDMFSVSKLHQTLHNNYYESILYGNGVVYKKRTKKGFVYLPLTIGQYYLDEDAEGTINTVARKFSMSVSQLIDTFGIDAMPKEIKLEIGRGNLDTDHNVIHIVEPNMKFLPDWENPYNKKYNSVYFLEDTRDEENEFLESKGMTRFPYLISRWDRYGTSVYGTGIGRSVLGDVNMLQSYERDLSKSSKKRISPPLKGGLDMKNVDVQAGAEKITYTNNPDGLSALFNVNYDTQQAVMNLDRIEKRLNSMFFLDIFLTMINKDKTMSATEANALDQEKMVILGAVVDRVQNEFLNPLVEGAFEDQLDAGMFPEPPASLQGRDISIKYSSVLSQTLDMTDLVLLERYLQFTASQAALDPKAAMFPKTSEINTYYARKVGINLENIHTTEEVERMFAEQQQAEQQQISVDESQAALNNAKATKELSQAGTVGDNILSGLMG